MGPRGNNVDAKQQLRNVAARNSLRMKTTKALHLVDKNSKSMVKLMQLQELARLDPKGGLDKDGGVLAHIESLKVRINRRLAKLAKWVDLPEIERQPLPLPGSRTSNYSMLLARQQQIAANQSRVQQQRQRMAQQYQQQGAYSNSAVAAAVLNAAQLVASSGAHRPGAVSSLPPVSALMPGVHIPISSLAAGQRAAGEGIRSSVSISGPDTSSSVPVQVVQADASVSGPVSSTYIPASVPGSEDEDDYEGAGEAMPAADMEE